MTLDAQHQMIDPWQLQSMRDQQEASYPDVADIYRLTRTDDGKGGFSKPVRELVADEVPATFAPAQQLTMGGQADRGLEVEKWTVRMPWGTDLQDADVVHFYRDDVWMQVEDAKVSKTRGTAVTAMAEKVKGQVP